MTDAREDVPPPVPSHDSANERERPREHGFDRERPSSIPTTRSENFFIEGGRIFKDAIDSKGTNHPRTLAEFTARIEQEIEKDDGAGTEIYYRISGALPSGRTLRTLEIPSITFPGMAWVHKHWGSQAIIPAGQGTAEYLREAVQRLSHPERQQVFVHTGWREIDGEWYYLHGQGALGANGPVRGVQVQLEGRLALYALPEPLVGEDPKAAWQSSVRLLDLSVDEVTVPLFLAIFRGAMGECPFSIHVSGAPFQGKTEACAIVSGHYGLSLDAQNTLEAWSSTEGAIERSLFLAKDAVGLVDDFKPSGSRKEIEDMHRKAERVFRGAFNRHGRSRLQTDGRGVKSDNYPRGLTLSTGEDLPMGHSLRSRVLLVDWPTGGTHWEVLSQLQDARARGIHAGLLATFLQWVAARRPALLKQMNQAKEEAAKLFQASNNRTGYLGADLWSVWAVVRGFVEALDLMLPTELEELQRRVWNAMQVCLAAQATHLKTSDPVQRFLDQLRAYLHAKQGHLTPVNHPVPDIWKAGLGLDAKGEPCGGCLGYAELDRGEVWLFPSVAYQAVEKLGPVGLSEEGLVKLMGEQGLIQRDADGWRNKRTLPGMGRVRVIVLKLSSLEEPEDSIDSLLGNLGSLG